MRKVARMVFIQAGAWQKLGGQTITAGLSKRLGIRLGCRDTLRREACKRRHAARRKVFGPLNGVAQ